MIEITKESIEKAINKARQTKPFVKVIARIDEKSRWTAQPVTLRARRTANSAREILTSQSAS
jgi:hypothetical protein